jgi:EmrB/QacA subfamily drug resistance transporter
MTSITEPIPTVATKAASRSKRPIVVTAIMLSTFMIAMEATIVATAMPRIVGQLGGFAFYTWVFSAYLLAQCTMTLIFGKLSDVFGRKPIMIAGLLVFLAGSLLAGFAGTMAWLIGFRLLQGIGAGAIQPMSITMIGDFYTQAERPRVQGYAASVWAGAAVLGPLAGGIIVDHAAWGWVFWVNLPIGALTIAGFAWFLHEDVTSRAAKIDYLGAVLFAITVVSFLFILTLTGLSTGASVALAATCIAAFVLFVLQELRAPEPMISLALWSRRLVATSNAASLLAGMALVGVTTVLPLYLQGVMNRTPVIAGLTLTALIVGWTFALTIANFFFKRIGIRKTLRAGSLTFPIGAIVLLFLTPESSPILASVGSLAMGMGIGLISMTSIVLVQESVEWSMRGSATSSILFSRSLGNAIGATVVGAILVVGIAHFGAGTQSEELHRLLNEPAGLADLGNDMGLRTVFDAALHWSFWGMLIVSVLSAAAAWMLPVVPAAAKRSG